MNRLVRGVCAAALLLGLGGLATPERSEAAEAVAIPTQDWSFDGIFGTFDRAAMQRGFQVYNEVCAACHSLRLVAFRNLGGPNGGGLGYSEDEVKAFAAE